MSKVSLKFRTRGKTKQLSCLFWLTYKLCVKSFSSGGFLTITITAKTPSHPQQGEGGSSPTAQYTSSLGNTVATQWFTWTSHRFVPRFLPLAVAINTADKEHGSNQGSKQITQFNWFILGNCGERFLLLLREGAKSSSMWTRQNLFYCPAFFYQLCISNLLNLTHKHICI